MEELQNIIDRRDRVCQYTSGEWENEDKSAEELDRRISTCELFHSFSEVCGYYVQPRFDSELKKPRIDRLLLPSQKLLKLGWKLGPVGIECKKLGPIVVQAMDYARAIFTIPTTGNPTYCRWIFIWPLNEFMGDIASVMAQHRIGGAYGHSDSHLKLKTGAGPNALEFSEGHVSIGNVRCGQKTGSR